MRHLTYCRWFLAAWRPHHTLQNTVNKSEASFIMGATSIPVVVVVSGWKPSTTYTFCGSLYIPKRVHCGNGLLQLSKHYLFSWIYHPAVWEEGQIISSFPPHSVMQNVVPCSIGPFATRDTRQDGSEWLTWAWTQGHIDFLPQCTTLRVSWHQLHSSQNTGRIIKEQYVYEWSSRVDVTETILGHSYLPDSIFLYSTEDRVQDCSS